MKEFNHWRDLLPNDDRTEWERDQKTGGFLSTITKALHQSVMVKEELSQKLIPAQN